MKNKKRKINTPKPQKLPKLSIETGPKVVVNPPVKEYPLWTGIKFWKLAISKCFFKCVMVGFTSIVATLNGAEWSTFTPTQKFVAIGSLVTAICGTAEAFLSDTMAKLTDKKNSLK